MTTRKIVIGKLLILLAVVALLPGCKKLFGLNKQEDYDYEKRTLDPHINITAGQFLENRSDGAVPADTVFKWMKRGLEYAEIDLAEYEKPGRTFIFLHNDAVRVINATSGAVTNGLWFVYPIVLKDGNGDPILDPITQLPQTRPATDWSDYSKETVRNYFLYLIGEGEFNFEDLNDLNKPVQSLLPPGTVATKESMLGYANEGLGFDAEGKFHLRILNNNDLAPIVFNDRTNDRSAGYIATNGVVHVYGAAVHPFR